MRLLEYESKQLLSEFGIPIPEKVVITSVEDLELEIPQPCILKAQVPIGSRKKAGLIKIAKTKGEARSIAEEIFSKEVLGKKIGIILIEGLAEIRNELYCSVALDASRRSFVVITSTEGGIDIEQVAKENPRAIHKDYIPDEGVTEEMSNGIAKKLGLPSEETEQIAKVILALWRITEAKDSQLTEVNPLAIIDKGVIALDGKIILDDNASYRRPLIKELREKKLSQREKKAAKEGFSFVQLDGDIGILANGAGLTMAVIDVLTAQDIKPANFLDVGGGASAKRVYEALSLLIELDPRAIFVNIYGGITRCDQVAEGILTALKEFEGAPPLVVRLSGTKEEEGREILELGGIPSFATVAESVEALRTL